VKLSVLVVSCLLGYATEARPAGRRSNRRPTLLPIAAVPPGAGPSPVSQRPRRRSGEMQTFMRRARVAALPRLLVWMLGCLSCLAGATASAPLTAPLQPRLSLRGVNDG
jgi:hypothetical protein